MIKKILSHSAKQLAILVGAFLIAFLMFLAVGVVKGQWQEPGAAPPDGDTPAPLNVGGQPQQKLSSTDPIITGPYGPPGTPGQWNGSAGFNDVLITSTNQWVSSIGGGVCTPIQLNIPQQNPPGQPVIPAHTSIFTPVSFYNNAATGGSGIPWYISQVPVPATCINSFCTIVGVRYLDNGDGSPNISDTLESLRTANIFQIEQAAGINPPQINWNYWTKAGATDGLDCDAGRNGTLSGCDGVMKTFESSGGDDKILIYDDVVVSGAGYSELSSLQWSIRDDSSNRYGAFYLCS